MSVNRECEEVRELRLSSRGTPPGRVLEHAERCAACRAEVHFDQSISRAVAELPAPDGDVAEAVLARIAAEPSALAVTLQVAVLGVLGLCLGTVLTSGLPIPDLDSSWVYGISSMGIGLTQEATGWIGTATSTVLETPVPPLALVVVVLAAIVALNVRVVLRPSEARNGT